MAGEGDPVASGQVAEEDASEESADPYGAFVDGGAAVFWAGSAML